MSKKIFSIILIILVPGIVNADLYESLPSQAQLNRDIEEFGANQVLGRIWNSDKAYSELLDKISSGDAEWVAVAVKLCAVSDAGATESLVMAMSRALAKHPVNVLSVLSPNHNRGPFHAGVGCRGSMLYINYTGREIEKWRKEAISAVSGVNAEGLEEIKELCLRSLSK